MEGMAVLESLIALVFVIALIFLVTFLLRKYGSERIVVKGKQKGKRLKVVEMLPIDNRRRLVLIQRDEVQHLLVISPDGETVIESGIGGFDNEVETHTWRVEG